MNGYEMVRTRRRNRRRHRDAFTCVAGCSVRVTLRRGDR